MRFKGRGFKGRRGGGVKPPLLTKSDLPMPHMDTEPYESKRLQQEEVNNCNNAPDIKKTR